MRCVDWTLAPRKTTFWLSPELLRFLADARAFENERKTVVMFKPISRRVPPPEKIPTAGGRMETPRQATLCL